jgi:hypothetical protein
MSVIWKEKEKKDMKKYFFKNLALCVVLTALASGQDRPSPVSLIQLVANAEKFDNRLVTVQGFLRITHERKHAARANLYLHEEDAKNLLNNDVLVIATEQMLRDGEKIDRKYVLLTGMVLAVHGAGETSNEAVIIKDVRTCLPWSDPNHPISEQNIPNSQLK